MAEIKSDNGSARTEPKGDVDDLIFCSEPKELPVSER